MCGLLALASSCERLDYRSRRERTPAPGSMRPGLRALAAGELLLVVGRVRLHDHLVGVRGRELRVIELVDLVRGGLHVPHLGLERSDLLRLLAVERLDRDRRADAAD